MSWEKLSHPKMYGFEEYFIVSLVIFIIIVMLKHLIYHTLYYWWYRTGRLYIPTRLNNILTRKSLPQRIFEYVRSGKGKCDVLSSTICTIESYCDKVEFALTIGPGKGDILENICSKRQPKAALVCHSLCGYAVLRILRSSTDCHVYVAEPDKDKCAFTQEFVELVGETKRVTVISKLPSEIIPRLAEDYNVKLLDFVFMTSSSLQAPYYHKILKLIEECNLLRENVADPDTEGTVILADKVIHFEESQFLKLVRYSGDYKTEYHQMPLEYSPRDVTDGMEKVTYVG